jgi:hypothetical protein
MAFSRYLMGVARAMAVALAVAAAAAVVAVSFVLMVTPVRVVLGLACGWLRERPGAVPGRVGPPAAECIA